MKRILLATVLLGVMLFTSGCFGPMSATGRLKTWNREIENRWAGEVVYLGLRVPYGGVYGLVFLSDVVVFNSIEFWGGQNPIGPVSPERLLYLRELDARRHGSGQDE